MQKKKKVQDKRSPEYNSQLLYWRQESIWVNKGNLWVRYKECLCNVDSDNMRNRRPGTDWEQNSLRYFCTAKGGCHIAGDGGREAGLHAEAALLASSELWGAQARMRHPSSTSADPLETLSYNYNRQMKSTQQKGWLFSIDIPKTMSLILVSRHMQSWIWWYAVMERLYLK